MESQREIPFCPPRPSPVASEEPKPRRGSRANVKLGPNVIEFDMLETEACELLGNLTKGLQAAGTTYEVHQDYNLIWISLP